MTRNVIAALAATFAWGSINQDCNAGTYTPPAPAKCPIEECPDIGGEISFGYDTDYILYGVRLARDSVWMDVNYTIDRLRFPITLGVWHLTSLSSAPGGNFDETDLYATINTPGFLGFETSAGYIQRFFPTLRGPSGTGFIGDSRLEFWVQFERELFAGFNAYYRRAYDYHVPAAFVPLTANRTDQGAWVHTFGLEKDFDLSDRAALALAGGVHFTDNFWPADMTALNGSPLDRARSSGWNNYFLRAALPVSLNCRTVVTPYIGYSGSPDTWIADGVDLGPGSNANDILHGGVSVSVRF